MTIPGQQAGFSIQYHFDMPIRLEPGDGHGGGRKFYRESHIAFLVPGQPSHQCGTLRRDGSSCPEGMLRNPRVMVGFELRASSKVIFYR